MREGLIREGPLPRLTPIATIKRLWLWRDFIWTLSSRELRARYVGSLGGVAWNIIQPLVLIFVFTVLFSSFLKMSPFQGGRGYLIYLVAALFPWNAFQEALLRSSSIFIENSNMVQKLPFPLESLIAQAIVVSTINLLISLFVLSVLLPFLGVKYSLTLLLLPAAVSMQIFLTAGAAFALAALTPFWRDVIPFTGMATFIGFWLTPVVYTPDILPPRVQAILTLNPVYHLIRFYRACFIGEGFPSYKELGGVMALSIFLLLIGWWIFSRLHRRVPEML